MKLRVAQPGVSGYSGNTEFLVTLGIHSPELRAAPRDSGEHGVTDDSGKPEFQMTQGKPNFRVTPRTRISGRLREHGVPSDSGTKSSG